MMESKSGFNNGLERGKDSNKVLRSFRSFGKVAMGER